jgi:hypothetical protein
MPENDGIYETWRNSPSEEMTFFYQEGDRVRHQGHKYICRIGHGADENSEPGMGETWIFNWDLVEEASISPKAAEEDWPWKGEWRSEPTEYYKCNDCVDSNGISYRSVYDHWPALNTEPGVGHKWEQVWQRLGQTKPEHQIKTQSKAKLFVVVEGATPTEVDIGDLADLIAKGDCNIHFEVRQPCKTINIADMQLIEIEETDEGTYAHFLILRDLTEE